MKIKTSWLGFIYTILVVAALSVFGVAQTAADTTDHQKSEANAVQFSFKTDKAEYARDETVRFAMVLSNAGPQAQTLTFTSGQSFDISATPVGAEKPVWRWAQGRMFTKNIREVTLQPGETLQLQAQWDQKNSAGALVPRGEYSLQAVIAAMERLQSPPLQIRLVA